jgi:hypothetical protein
MTTRVPFILPKEQDDFQQAVEREVARRLSAATSPPRRKHSWLLNAVLACLLLIAGWNVAGRLPELPDVRLRITTSAPTVSAPTIRPDLLSATDAANRSADPIVAQPDSRAPSVDGVVEAPAVVDAPAVAEAPLPVLPTTAPLPTAEILPMPPETAKVIVQEPPRVFAHPETGALYTPVPIDAPLPPPPPPPPPPATDYRVVAVSVGPGAVKQCVVLEDRRICDLAGGIDEYKATLYAGYLQSGLVPGEPHSAADEVQ